MVISFPDIIQQTWQYVLLRRMLIGVLIPNSWFFFSLQSRLCESFGLQLADLSCGWLWLRDFQRWQQTLQLLFQSFWHLCVYLWNWGMHEWREQPLGNRFIGFRLGLKLKPVLGQWSSSWVLSFHLGKLVFLQTTSEEFQLSVVSRPDLVFLKHCIFRTNLGSLPLSVSMLFLPRSVRTRWTVGQS